MEDARLKNIEQEVHEIRGDVRHIRTLLDGGKVPQRGVIVRLDRVERRQRIFSWIFGTVGGAALVAFTNTAFDWLRSGGAKVKSWLVLCIVLTLPGCGPNPWKVEAPGNELRARRGAGYAELSVRSTADTDASFKAKGLRINKSEGEFTADEIEVTYQSAQSRNQREQIGLMREYTGQLIEAYKGRAEEARIGWAGVNQLAGTAAGVVGPFLAGKLNLDAIKAQRPQLVDALLAGIATGQVDGGVAMQRAQAVDPALARELLERIEALAKQLANKPAATQPI